MMFNCLFLFNLNAYAEVKLCVSSIFFYISTKPDPMLTEKYLQFIWNHRLAGHVFETSEREKVEIFQPGLLNTDGGPDFLNARIRIGDTVWAGNIEIHIKSSDWNRHKHQYDPAYDSVILHVVADNDTDICRSTGEIIPTVELPPLEKIKNSYETLLSKRNWTACEDYILDTDAFILDSWKQRLLIERLEQKVEAVQRWLHQTKNDWEQVLFIALSRSLSARLNADNFERLALSIPVNRLLKLKGQNMGVEALFFGKAGLLPEASDNEYVAALVGEFTFQQKKFHIAPLADINWQFMRMRPANFPTIRLAQLAVIMKRHFPLFAKVLDSEIPDQLKDVLGVRIDGYWENHYHFGKESTAGQKALGKNTVHSIIINAIIPVLFAYGKFKHDDRHSDKALLWLEQLPPEKNSIIDNWKRIGLSVKHAAETQALIQLKKVYCDNNRCLDCRIGANLISDSLV